MTSTSSLFHYTLLTGILFCLCKVTFAQNLCDNIGFERGTTDGFELYYGTTSNILNDTPLRVGTSTNQHVIQRRTDGIDELAATKCIANKSLPVVGQGLGEYSLRIGDSPGGRIVSRIVREMEVTPENNFLILSYAVLLEDPNHEREAQPRFIFKIKDTDDQVLSCGEYDVFAGRDIEGFENCGDWRVRPWTSAGFELQSFLGQTVRLEITTIDCDHGAHGGYAYVDLTCRPLEIILSNYCPEEQTAYMTVTAGFEKYLWNTGATSDQIFIENPQPGEIFSVEVTSASGCTITLRDTLPPFESLPLAIIHPEEDTTMCLGEEFLFSPRGENIARLELLGSGYVYDDILINSLTDRTYTFVASDLYGCEADTMSFNVRIIEYPEVTTQEITDVNCINDSGSILAMTKSDYNNRYSIDGGVSFQDTNYFANLDPGNYIMQITNDLGCDAEHYFRINNLNSVATFGQATIIQPNCNLNNGSVRLTVLTGTNPYQYSDDGENFVSSNRFENLPPGPITFYVEDANYCIDSIELVLEAIPAVEIELLNTITQHCNQPNGTIEVKALSGEPPFRFAINGSPFVDNQGLFEYINAGTHSIQVKDAADCIATLTVELDNIAPLAFTNLSQTDDHCSQSQGQIGYQVIGGQPPYELELDGVTISLDNEIYALSEGTYRLQLTDALGCIMEENVYIGNIPKPEIEINALNHLTCNLINGHITLGVTQGTAPFLYSFDNNNFQNKIDYSELGAGDHQVIVEDINGCRDSMVINLDIIQPPEIIEANFEVDECNDYTVYLQMDSLKGCEPYIVSYQEEQKTFEKQTEITLEPGQHEVIVTDNCDCTTYTHFEFANIAKYYIPNTIQFQSGQGNNRFQIFKHHKAEGFIKTMKVYDRWGNEVYGEDNLGFDADLSQWWNGRVGHLDFATGVYVYYIDISDDCNNSMVYTGNLTLIK